MNSKTGTDFLSADVEGLLHFFDEKPDGSIGHATSVVGVVGEDLNTACFQHCLNDRGGRAVVLRDPVTGRPRPVTTGHTKGPRLDRWIKVDWCCGSTTVFQTEIKSWSAHGFGGVRFPLNGSAREVRRRKREQWDDLWDSRRRRLKHPMTLKVLERMRPLDGVEPEIVRPLLIFWAALESRESPNEHLFSVDVDSKEFQELWVFSVSGYLRSLQSKSVRRIELEMPDAALRLRSLVDWFLPGITLAESE